MSQEQVEGADGLLDHDGDPFYIVEGDVDLLGPVADVRRAAGGQQRHHHDRPHQDDQGDERQDLGFAVGQVRGAEQVADQHRDPQPDADHGADEQQAVQAPLAGVLPGHAHVGDVGGAGLVRRGGARCSWLQLLRPVCPIAGRGEAGSWISRRCPCGRRRCPMPGGRPAG